jgi:PTS hybrid protein
MSENVGIVIVSHSADVARGTALMVEQMVGREVPLGWCGGDPGGGLGTSVEAIMKAIDQAWSESPFWSTSAARKPTARWR